MTTKNFIIMILITLLIFFLMTFTPVTAIDLILPDNSVLSIEEIDALKNEVEKIDYNRGDSFVLENSDFSLTLKNDFKKEIIDIVYFKYNSRSQYYVYSTANGRYGIIENGSIIREYIINIVQN